MNPRDLERRIKEHKKQTGYKEPRAALIHKNKGRIGTDKSLTLYDTAMIRAFHEQLDLIVEKELDTNLHTDILDSIKYTLEKKGQKNNVTLLFAIKSQYPLLSDSEKESIIKIVDTFNDIPTNSNRVSHRYINFPEGRDRMMALWPNEFQAYFKDKAEYRIYFQEEE